MDFRKSREAAEPKKLESLGQIDLGLEQHEQELEKRHGSWISDKIKEFGKEVKDHPYMTEFMVAAGYFGGSGLRAALTSDNSYTREVGFVMAGASAVGAALIMRAYNKYKALEAESKAEK